jgi:phosphoglycerol transferase MdoB-like AlkP superfamily enzyme
MKYADYAIGKFFELARRAPYFERTLFVVLADHDARVYAATLEEVIRHYEVHLGFIFTDQERADLAAFLKAL